MGTYYSGKLDEIEKIPVLRDKIIALNILLSTYLDAPRADWLVIINKCLDQAARENYIDGEVFLRFNLVFIYQSGNEKEKAEAELESAKRCFECCTDPEAKMYGYSILAYTHWFAGEYDLAFEKIFSGIKIEESLSEDRGMIGKGWTNYALAVFYFDTKEFDNSAKYYERARQWFAKADHEYGMARARNGLASVLIATGRQEEGRSILLEILSVYRKVEVATGESRALTDLGLIERNSGNYERAMNYFTEAYAVRKRGDHLHGLITSLNELGHTLFLMGRHEEAHGRLKEAEELATRINSKAKLYRVCQLLSTNYKAMNDPWKALEYLEKFYEIKSQVVGEQAINKMKEMQTRFATEKSQKETEIHRLKNIELKKAYDEIENKNREILDSINYAKRIQMVLMPNERLVEKMLRSARNQ